MVLNIFKKKKKPEPKAQEAPKVQDAAVPVSHSAASANPVLRHFHVSEKSGQGMAQNQYTFIVDPRANKSEIRDAVERSYKVDVRSVNIVRLPAKQRTLGRYRGTVPGKKKAIVTLAKGQTIASAQP